MMTRQHFQVIADTLKPHVQSLSDAESEISKEIATSFANSLQNENPRFDRERFLKACGFALALWVAVPQIATAQETSPPPCGEQAEVIAMLAAGYGEYPVWRGVSKDHETLVTVFENEHTGTWTATATDTGRRSCLLSSGEQSKRGLPL